MILVRLAKPAKSEHPARMTRGNSDYEMSKHVNQPGFRVAGVSSARLFLRWDQRSSTHLRLVTLPSLQVLDLEALLF